MSDLIDIKEIIGSVNKQTDGTWIEYPGVDGVEFKIAYLGIDAYQDFIVGRMNRLRRGSRDVPPDKAREVVKQGLVRFILKGWKGVGSEGVEYEFNDENAKALLTASPAIRDFIIREADRQDNFGIVEEKKGEAVAADEVKSGPALEPRMGSGD